MATGVAFFSASLGPTNLKTCEAWSGKSSSFVKTPSLKVQRKLIHRRTNNLSVCAQYNESRGGGAVEFISGFLLGGAICGALGYVFAPEIRRSILNENEAGFQKARRPIYYDDLERNRESLNERIQQLNSVIDKVTSRLRGNKNQSPSVVKFDPADATF
ncbi:unnamed protein product [Cuscuta epithymum]|uniref:Uncharacterized protein n=1 Tax=Cuscuta epithymum TaxID=186058 RepID=A0AAV0C7W5_9ASTE|nr:unnamed protein product [Cuscuta epithymum]CAH9143031.1 unnamed protein product [Cuscuta epithymum]